MSLIPGSPHVAEGYAIREERNNEDNHEAHNKSEHSLYFDGQSTSFFLLAFACSK